jgi:hypothetical protein
MAAERISENAHSDVWCQRNLTLAYLAQKARLRLMDIRVVEETDANRQAPLDEPIAGGTPYNDFNTP